MIELAVLLAAVAIVLIDGYATRGRRHKLERELAEKSAQVEALGVLARAVLAHPFAEECQECAIGQSHAWTELKMALADKKV